MKPGLSSGLGGELDGINLLFGFARGLAKQRRCPIQLMRRRSFSLAGSDDRRLPKPSPIRPSGCKISRRCPSITSRPLAWHVSNSAQLNCLQSSQHPNHARESRGRSMAADTIRPECPSKMLSGGERILFFIFLKHHAGRPHQTHRPHHIRLRRRTRRSAATAVV